MSVTARAAAKINLHLGVGPVRDDGFHPLHTVYQAIGVYDDVTATRAEAWSVAIEAVGDVDVSGVPLDDSNLVVRAGRALLQHHDVAGAAHLRIAKGIPVAGGLAGGSADAAAALVALDRLFALGTPPEELQTLAASLGSDVPFALLGGTAVGRGRGEHVRPVVDNGAWWWVVVPSVAGLSTPAVYREFDRGHDGSLAEPEAAYLALDAGDAVALGAALRNDLQAPALALRPDLAPTLARLRDSSALGVLLSGSGPTCLALVGDHAHAVRLTAELADAGLPALLAPAPVEGARVVAP